MALRNIAGNMSNISSMSYSLRRHMILTSLRFISTSNLLYARGMRKHYRERDFSESEMQNYEEELDDVTPEELMEQASDISREASNFQGYIQQKTIKHKYFKEYEHKEEQLLTWEMREQLKYLHASDPNEWTPETLSVAFPVSPSGVLKLLKSQWVPESEEDIKKHNRAVIARWKKYTNGRLGSAKLLEEIVRQKIGQRKETLPVPLMDPEEMLMTLESLKFHSDEKPRDPDDMSNKLPKKKVSKMKSGSFVSIIENYESQLPNKEQTDNHTSAEKENFDGHISTPTIVSGTPEYEGSYSKVSSKNMREQFKSSRSSRNKLQMITYDEFLAQKSGS